MLGNIRTAWTHRKDAGLVAIAVLAVVSLGGAIWLGFHDRTASGGLLAGLGLLLLAFVQLSRFKRFKGMGFEAELWEAKQEEAEDLINRTRALLAILSAATLRSAPRMGRWMVGFERRELLDLVSNVETALERAGVPPAEIKPMRSEVDRLIAFDLAMKVTKAISKAVWKRAEEMTKEMTAKHGSVIHDNVGFGEDVTRRNAVQSQRLDPNDLADTPRTEWPAALRRRITALPEFSEVQRTALEAATEEELLDLEAWVARGEIRRPDVFFNPKDSDDET